MLEYIYVLDIQNAEVLAFTNLTAAMDTCTATWSKRGGATLKLVSRGNWQVLAEGEVKGTVQKIRLLERETHL